MAGGSIRFVYNPSMPGAQHGGRDESGRSDVPSTGHGVAGGGAGGTASHDPVGGLGVATNDGPGVDPGGDADAPAVSAASYLTLHYRVSLADTGTDVINTFGEKPATLQMGVGQMAEPLERCLLGLREGRQARFELAPEQAFGARQAAAVQRVPLPLTPAAGGSSDALVPGDLVTVPARGGARMTGVLKAIGTADALVDFNHPLAGHRLVFEVRILGVL